MLEWKVYYHDFNKDEVETHNVFDHYRFHKDLCSLVKKHKIKEGFEEELRRTMKYYYWSKAEWEVLVYPWVGRKDSKPIKIDVYDQVANNWNVFVDYIWENRDMISEDW